VRIPLKVSDIVRNMRADHDPLDVRAQQRDAEDRARRELLAQHFEAEDIKWVMAHPTGRSFMWRLLDKAGLYRSTMTGNSQTFFNEGMRNFGIYLIALINEHCAEQYALMVAESKGPPPEGKDKK
jgi:hypothetical protein